MIDATLALLYAVVVFASELSVGGHKTAALLAAVFCAISNTSDS